MDNSQRRKYQCPPPKRKKNYQSVWQSKKHNLKQKRDYFLLTELLKITDW